MGKLEAETSGKKPQPKQHMRASEGRISKSATKSYVGCLRAQGHRCKRSVAAAARASEQVGFILCAEALRSVRQELRGQQLLLSVSQATATHILTLMAVVGLALGATAQACHTALLTHLPPHPCMRS